MAELIGHLGGGLMILFVALLALRCARRLGLVPAGRASWVSRSGPKPGYEPGPGALVLAFLGVLAVQWLFAWLCWRSLSQPGGAPAFFAHFWQRFTTAGDSPHYLLLARQGYVAQGEAAKYIVFYPLYPLLIRLAHFLLAPLGAGWELAALAVSQLCWGGAGAGMLRLAGLDLNREGAFTAVGLMALYPFGFFSLGVYTEGPFLLLCLLCMGAARRGRWVQAGLWGFLAALTRTQGLVLALPLAYLWLRARRREKQGPASLGLCLVPLGFGTYLLLNKLLFGRWFEFLAFQAAPPWYQSTRWIGQNLAQHWQMAQEYPGLAPFIYNSQLALYFVGIALLLWGLAGRAPTFWLIWGGAYQGMSYLPGWLISGSRYMFGCLPLFLLGAALRSRAARLALLAVSGGLLYYFGVFYMQGQAIM